MYIKKKMVAVVVFLLLAVPLAVVEAQGGSGGFPGGSGGSAGGSGGYPGGSGSVVTLDNPINADSFIELLDGVLNAIFVIALPFAVLAVVFAGFLFVTARGKPEKLAVAKHNFLWIIVGIGVVFGAWVLVKILINVMRVLGADV